MILDLKNPEEKIEFLRSHPILLPFHIFIPRDVGNDKLKKRGGVIYYII